MPYLTAGTEGGADIELYYNDWGSGYPGTPRGICTTEKDNANADLLAFIKA